MVDFTSTRAPEEFQTIIIGNMTFEFPIGMADKEISEILDTELEDMELATVGGREEARAKGTIFDAAMIAILANEGGYVNDPNDPGGETNFGISKRSYPDTDIFNLTEEEAVAIYRRDFWEANRYGEMSPALAGKMLDMSVNLGSTQANKLLQRVVDTKADGILGDKTLRAVSKAEEEETLKGLTKELKRFYRNLANKNPRLRRFLKGWNNRAEGLPIPAGTEFTGLSTEGPVLATPEEEVAEVISEAPPQEIAQQTSSQEPTAMDPGFFQREDGTFFELTSELEIVEHGS